MDMARHQLSTYLLTLREGVILVQLPLGPLHDSNMRQLSTAHRVAFATDSHISLANSYMHRVQSTWKLISQNTCCFK